MKMGKNQIKKAVNAINNQYNFYGENVQVTDEAYEYLDKKIYESYKTKLKARKVIPVTKLPGGVGKETIKKYKKTEPGEAIVTESFQQSTDEIALSGSSQTVPLIIKNARIKRRDLATAESAGLPIRAHNVMSASRKIAEKENEMLMNGISYDGGSNYAYNGLYQAGVADGTTSVSGSTWGTSSNIESDILSCLEALEGVSDPPYYLALNKAEYFLAGKLIGNSDSSYLNWMKEMGITPFITGELGSSKAMMFPKTNSPEYFEYRESVPLKHEEEVTGLADKQGGRDLFVQIFQAGVLEVHRGDAICILTGHS